MKHTNIYQTCHNSKISLMWPINICSPSVIWPHTVTHKCNVQDILSVTNGDVGSSTAAASMTMGGCYPLCFPPLFLHFLLSVDMISHGKLTKTKSFTNAHNEAKFILTSLAQLCSQTVTDLFLSNNPGKLGSDVSLNYITAVSVTLNIITTIISTVNDGYPRGKWSSVNGCC